MDAILFFLFPFSQHGKTIFYNTYFQNIPQNSGKNGERIIPFYFCLLSTNGIIEMKSLPIYVFIAIYKFCTYFLQIDMHFADMYTYTHI